MKSTESRTNLAREKKRERRGFIFITVFLFPALSVILVGGYGFIIWISQMLFGPPSAG
jgi:nitrate reductase NapE